MELLKQSWKLSILILIKLVKKEWKKLVASLLISPCVPTKVDLHQSDVFVNRIPGKPRCCWERKTRWKRKNKKMMILHKNFHHVVLYTRWCGHCVRRGETTEIDFCFIVSRDFLCKLLVLWPIFFGFSWKVCPNKKMVRLISFWIWFIKTYISWTKSLIIPLFFLFVSFSSLHNWLHRKF